MKHFLFLALCALSGAARAQAPLTAAAAYEYLQGQRARVRAVVGEADKPPADSLQKGVRLLQAALAYYHRPAVEALAKTNESLYFRQSDILFDLAQLQGQLGQPAAAAASLQQLASGLMAHVCTKRNMYPDGTEWNGIGIQPTLLVRPTVAALQAGQDPMLDAALRYLSASPALCRARQSAGGAVKAG